MDGSYLRNYGLRVQILDLFSSKIRYLGRSSGVLSRARNHTLETGEGGLERKPAQDAGGLQSLLSLDSRVITPDAISCNWTHLH